MAAILGEILVIYFTGDNPGELFSEFLFLFKEIWLEFSEPRFWVDWVVALVTVVIEEFKAEDLFNYFWL